MFGVHANKKIEGRTRIQKEVCLLKFKAKIPFSYDFKSYFYGPYSEELSETINTLVGVKLIKENTISVGYNSYRYEYALTEQGDALFKRISKSNRDLIKELQKEVKNIECLSTPILVKQANSNNEVLLKLLHELKDGENKNE